MEFLPVFFDLRGRLCLVVGGGVAAADKAALLLAAGARIAVIAETLDPRFSAWIADGVCEHRATKFDAAHLADMTLVISAASESLDRVVSETAQARALPVNIVDRRELSSFIVPAIIDRSPVVVAVSTGGAAPMLARLLRDRIARALPNNCGRLAALARCFRPLVRATLPDIPARRRFWHGILSGHTAALIEAGDEVAARAELRRELRAQAAFTPTGGVAGTRRRRHPVGRRRDLRHALLPRGSTLRLHQKRRARHIRAAAGRRRKVFLQRFRRQLSKRGQCGLDARYGRACRCLCGAAACVSSASIPV